MTLQILDLSNNKGIQVLPNEMGSLERLQVLDLTGLKLKEPPEQYRKSAHDCVEYLKSKLCNTKPFYSMKLMLVGKENRGKTTLVARLQGREQTKLSTVGVDISEWECNIDGPNTFYFSIWDFAGQEEYYATHQCFLSDCSIYLLLFNLKDGKGALTEIEPWLSNIALRAESSCVHIVGTHLDEVPQECRPDVESLLADIQTQAEFYVSNVQVHAVSLKNPLENMDKLKESIYRSASEYRARGALVMGQVVPESYHKLYHFFRKELAAGVKQHIRSPILVKGEYVSLVHQICGSTLDSKELTKVTQFLIDSGVLLHYDDLSHNLDELYFVDPRWLCDMMSSIVSIKEKNPYVRDGILLLKNIGKVLRDEKFPSQHFGQYLTLLDRFEIAFAIDNQQILIPSLLPDTPPISIYEQLGKEPAYTRNIVFDVRTTPPGFWSRMLSRVMHSVPQLKFAINISHDFSEHSEVDTAAMPPADRFLSSVSLSQPTFVESSQVRLTYWKSGIYYKDSDVFFGVWSLKTLSNHSSEGICITASHNTSGRKLCCQLIDVATALCDVEFASRAETKHTVPCPSCMQRNSSNPDVIDVNDCNVLLEENRDTITCKENHTIPISDIIPDLLLSDLDSRFNVQNIGNLQCDTEQLGRGGEAIVYSGTYMGQPVAIKKYGNITIRNNDNFRQLRKEILLFQKLYHPCLINLVAVTIRPTIEVILERAPLGSLEEYLITKQQQIHRVVTHRIAAQVAAALRAIHNMGIIHRDLKASNVLLWSLDPESLCHCKLTDYGTATEQAPIGTRAKPEGTVGFVAPEALGKNGYQYIYNHTSDVFSYAMLLYQMIARREPYHDIKDLAKNNAAIRGERPKLQDVAQAENVYFYLTRLMKLCWQEEPDHRPTTTEIVIKASLSSMQSIMCVLPVQNGLGLRPSCIVSLAELVKAGVTCESSEMWICSTNKNEDTEIDIYLIATMKSRMHFTIPNTVHCISVCGSNVWVSSRSGMEHSQIQIFNLSNGALVCEIPMKDDSVSCIASTDHAVYCGTIEGSCILFPENVLKITPRFQPVVNKISDNCIDSVVVTHDYLWVSNAHNIHLLDFKTLAIRGAVTTTTEITNQRTFSQQIHPRFKRTSSNSVLDRRLRKAHIGQMKLSLDERIVWSSHLHSSISVHAWSAVQREMMFGIYIDEHMKKVAQCSEQGMLVTAMTPALDTLWVGTMSGHILVFGNETLLTWFHPYLDYVRFLQCVDSDQADGRAKVISGGKSFRSPIADMSAYQGKDEKGEPVDTAGTLVLWEAFPAKIFGQVQLVQDSSYTFLNDHDTVRNVIAVGKFNDSTHLSDYS